MSHKFVIGLGFGTNITPLDKDLILKAAAETGAIVTAEEHNMVGGLGAAVCDLVCAKCRVPVIRDEFGRSGPAEELLTFYRKFCLIILFMRS